MPWRRSAAAETAGTVSSCTDIPWLRWEEIERGEGEEREGRGQQHCTILALENATSDKSYAGSCCIEAL